ncbi:MAG: O-antigen ligase family protein [Chitinophagaceae bacterium]|nr:O-antigen ligase family protein [Oligoflexus sp.]
MAKAHSRLHTMETFLLWFLGASLCLDAPSARAFNEYDSWTKAIGQFLFLGFKELFNIPIPFTPFELLSYGSLFAILCLWGTQRAHFWKVTVGVAVLVPLAGVWAWVSGVARGNEMALAFTQFHFIPLIPVWLALGYFMGLRPSNNLRIYRIFFWVMFVKCFYALCIYTFIYNMDMGTREYLIDHPTSIYIVCGMLYGFWQLLRADVALERKFFYAFALLIMGTAYIINDRRASYAGIIIAVLLVPMLLPHRLRRDVWTFYKIGIAAAAIIMGFFAIDASNPYSFSGGLKSELTASDSLSYRHIENFNLLSGVVLEPILGIGFGKEYPQVMQLPDISGTFSLFAAIPHNTLFFLWTYAGPIGIGCFATLLWMSMILIIRCGVWARSSNQLFYAILAHFLTAQWVMFVFFDMGLLEVRSLMVFGLVVGSLYPQYARHIKEYYDENLA